MTDESLRKSLSANDNGTQVLYEQLQGEYNKLLKQYAAAENTIDELRTGATVHLYTEPIESRPNVLSPSGTATYPQNVTLHQPQLSTMSDTFTNFTTGGRLKSPTRGTKNSECPSLQTRIRALKEDVSTVESLSCEGDKNNEETLNELLVICTQLHKEHGTLSAELKLQSRNNIDISFRGDANDLRTKTELQKELHRIGLHIQEIQGDIMARLKTKKPISNASELLTLPNDEKPTLNHGFESLIKEMKDLKDASIKNSEEVLSRIESTQTGRDSTPRIYADANHDEIDSCYFTASPVNMHNPANSFSGSAKSEQDDEQQFNMTWPPTRNMTDSDIGVLRHSFSAPTRHYEQLSPNDMNIGATKSYQFMQSMNESPSDRKEQATQHEVDSAHKANMGKSQPILAEKNLYRKSEQSRSDVKNSERPGAEDSDNTKRGSPFTSQETLRYISDPNQPEVGKRERYNSANMRRKTSCSDNNEKRLPKHPYAGHDCSDEESVYQKESPAESVKQTQNINKSSQSRLASPDHGARKFNCMSSLADSSRMSTPLFQPRGSTRVFSHLARRSHVPRYKQRHGHTGDDVDSGFVGSETSRSLTTLTTDRPDGVQKISISNQWDSSLHLDLVSEIDENDSPPSEQLSTTYDNAPEDGPRSPKKATRRQQNHNIKFINASPSPPSSAERSPRSPDGYFRYRTSCRRSPSNSLPVYRTGDPALSRVNERPFLERKSSSGNCSSDGETSRKRMVRHRINRDESDSRVDNRRINRGGSPSHNASTEVMPNIKTTSDITAARPRETTEEHDNERKLQVLRNELNLLQDHVNRLQQPHDMYDEFREHNEQLQRAHERRYEKKLDEVRRAIAQLKMDQTSRIKNVPTRTDLKFFEDFRSQLRALKDQLDELTSQSYSSERPVESPTIYVSPSESFNVSTQDENMARRFSNLVRKVDELRLKIENRNNKFDPPRVSYRHFCRLCDEIGLHQDTSVTTDHHPLTSTPFVSHLHPERKELLRSAYPSAILRHSPVVHHIHTYHKSHGVQQPYETDPDDKNYEKRTPHRKRRSHRPQYRPGNEFSYADHLSLDDARKAAWDVQRLSKNILNSISLDLTSLGS